MSTDLPRPVPGLQSKAAGIRDGGKTPLFRSATGRTGTLTEKSINRVDAWRMIQRRAAELGMDEVERIMI